jgi:hypothetical protein
LTDADLLWELFPSRRWDFVGISLQLPSKEGCNCATVDGLWRPALSPSLPVCPVVACWISFPFGFGDPDGSPGGMLELILFIEFEKRSEEYDPKRKEKISEKREEKRVKRVEKRRREKKEKRSEWTMI